MKCIIPVPEFSFFYYICFCCISGLYNKRTCFFIFLELLFVSGFMLNSLTQSSPSPKLSWHIFSESVILGFFLKVDLFLKIISYFENSFVLMEFKTLDINYLF